MFILLIFLMACVASKEPELPPGYKLMCSIPPGKYTLWLPDYQMISATTWDTKEEAIEFAVWRESKGKSAMSFDWSEDYKWEGCESDGYIKESSVKLFREGNIEKAATDYAWNALVNAARGDRIKDMWEWCETEGIFKGQKAIFGFWGISKYNLKAVYKNEEFNIEAHDPNTGDIITPTYGMHYLYPMIAYCAEEGKITK